MLAVIAGFNALGRIFWASLSDWLGRRAVFMLFFAVQALLFAAIPSLAAGGHWPLFQVAVVLIFTMYGGGFATIPAFTTGANGQFNFQAVTGGAYTVRVTATNFTPFASNVTVAGNQTTQVGASLVPVGTTGVSFTLTWGATPSDLDAHLTTPQGTHIYYANAGNCAVACLDADATSGFGPETITIGQQTAGDYFFHVHNYTNCTGNGLALASSGATVRVYFNGVLQQTLTVPNLPGVDWGVFRLNGTTITPVNSMAATAPSGVQCSSGGGGAGAGKRVR
jgi:hypothetical protein